MGLARVTKLELSPDELINTFKISSARLLREASLSVGEIPIPSEKQKKILLIFGLRYAT